MSALIPEQLNVRDSSVTITTVVTLTIKTSGISIHTIIIAAVMVTTIISASIFLPTVLNAAIIITAIRTPKLPVPEL